MKKRGQTNARETQNKNGKQFIRVALFNASETKDNKQRAQYFEVS